MSPHHIRKENPHFTLDVIKDQHMHVTNTTSCYRKDEPNPRKSTSEVKLNNIGNEIEFAARVMQKNGGTYRMNVQTTNGECNRKAKETKRNKCANRDLTFNKV